MNDGMSKCCRIIQCTLEVAVIFDMRACTNSTLSRYLVPGTWIPASWCRSLEHAPLTTNLNKPQLLQSSTGIRTRGAGGGGRKCPPSSKHRGQSPLHLAMILYSLLYCHEHVKDLLVVGLTSCRCSQSAPKLS